MIPQAELMERVLPVIKSQGSRYRKTTEVEAKVAEGGEHVVSETSSGKETENTAEAGDYIVRNKTSSREQYIVSAEKFAERYDRKEESSDGFDVYTAKGEVLAIEIDENILRLLGQSGDFEIEAPWGEAQYAAPDDFLVTPPDHSEIYRIGRREFEETYAEGRIDK